MLTVTMTMNVYETVGGWPWGKTMTKSPGRRYIISKQQSNIYSFIQHIWRGVRSTLHFSPKNLRISKWSKLDKNGSKHSMFYQYLWLTMWFHTNKSKEMLKKPKTKSLILLYMFGSRAQKWRKLQINIAKGTMDPGVDCFDQ